MNADTWQYDIESDSFTFDELVVTSAELSFMDKDDIDMKYPGLRLVAFLLYGGVRIDEVIDDRDNV